MTDLSGVRNLDFAVKSRFDTPQSINRIEPLPNYEIEMSNLLCTNLMETRLVAPCYECGARLSD